MHSPQAPYNQAPFNGGDPTAHRDARTMPQPGAAHQRRGRIPALALGAYAIGLLGVVVAAITLGLFLSFKAQAQGELHQARKELATEQANLSKVQLSNDSRYTKLFGSVSGVANALAPYSMICSQALIGPSGPAQYYFACSNTKP
jgi:hypothetical protein